MERFRLPLEEIFIVSVVLVLLLLLLLHAVEVMSLHGDVMDVNVEQDFDDTSFDASKPNASVWRMILQDSTAAETAAAASVVVTIRRGRDGIVCSE